jgi:hypothetical protein
VWPCERACVMLAGWWYIVIKMWSTILAVVLWCIDVRLGFRVIAPGGFCAQCVRVAVNLVSSVVHLCVVVSRVLVSISLVVRRRASARGTSPGYPRHVRMERRGELPACLRQVKS